MKQYILISLYNGKSSILGPKELNEWIAEMDFKKGSHQVWMGEEYMVIEVDAPAV